MAKEEGEGHHTGIPTERAGGSEGGGMHPTKRKKGQARLPAGTCSACGRPTGLDELQRATGLRCLSCQANRVAPRPKTVPVVKVDEATRLCREELAKRIAAGKIPPEVLNWREGLRRQTDGFWKRVQLGGCDAGE